MAFTRWPTAVPKLPDISTLSYPASAIRMCRQCRLRDTCTAPVPGENIEPCEIMLVAQGPGFQEDRTGKPFQGPSGRYLDSLLFLASIPRSSVAISNVLHCLTPGNRPPKASELAACVGWIDIEVEIVRPRIIAAMGAPAIAHFLGPDAGTVEHLHGKPVEDEDGRIILPMYHPAAALRDTARQRQCQEDFEVLRDLAKGARLQSFHAVDAFPEPDYRVADTPALIRKMLAEIEESGEYAVDTEICRNHLWSAQFSAHEGTAWFVPLWNDKANRRTDLLPWAADGRVDLTGIKATSILHNYLFDVNYVKVPDDNFLDSMVGAYITGNSQGLKDLASRLCGIRMKTYREVVRVGQQEVSLNYLIDNVYKEWPDPPVIEETKWDNKAGRLVLKRKKPWKISRKINNILKDYTEGDVDLWDRWRHIPEEERAVVESVAGPMPEASLQDIPFSEAVVYANRDSDSTLRVMHALQKQIEELELETIFETDLRTMPMAHRMMRTGMPVNMPYVEELIVDYQGRLEEKAELLANMVGHPFNPASSPQVAKVIYDELGFTPTKKTKSGLISTDDAELKKTGCEPAKETIRYRGLLKLKSTYADALFERSVPDAVGLPRIHTTIKTTRVETGRWSSAYPMNLQNIPTRNKESRRIKSAIKAPDGWKLAEGDLCQIEMATQAHLAKCKGLIELFNRGGDPHTETAARVFGLPLEEAKQPKYRYPVKRLGFGVIYLIGPMGLATQINEYIADLEMEGEPIDIEPWDEITCAKFIEDYYKLYPEIRDYQFEQMAYARRYGFTRDIFGRIRYIPEIFCPIQSVKNAGERQAANFPVTSSAQSILKAAMCRMWVEGERDGWTKVMRWLMQIHDSLLVEIRDDDELIRRWAAWMSGIASSVVQLLVPVRMDFKTGLDWGKMEPMRL